MVAEAIREEDSEAEAVWRALEDGAGACSVGPYMVRVEVHIDESGDYSYLEADTEREEEARRWFRAHGYGKHDSWLRARRQAQEDAARLEGLAEGHWWFVGIVATASMAGRDVGYSSCWGYESDSGEYLEAEALGHIGEALREARAGNPQFRMV